MREMKLVSIMIVSILLGAGISSICIAQPLDGNIDVEIKQQIGIVSPAVNLNNSSSINLSAEFIEEENNSYYMINDTIEIDLNVTDTEERENAIFSRSLFYSAIVVRKSFKIMPFSGFLRRIFPVFKIGAEPLIESALGKNASDQIVLPIKFNVVKDSIGTEEMTLHLFVMGMLPGDVNGIDGLKIVEYKKVDLTVNYDIIS